MEMSKSCNNLFSKSSLVKKKLNTTSSHFNIKTIKFSEIYKQLYSSKTGETIKFLKNENLGLKTNNEKSYMKKYWHNFLHHQFK